jgi:hypothetical protein
VLLLAFLLLSLLVLEVAVQVDGLPGHGAGASTRLLEASALLLPVVAAAWWLAVWPARVRDR